jgi:hypothetical protein
MGLADRQKLCTFAPPFERRYLKWGPIVIGMKAGVEKEKIFQKK